MIDEEIEDVVIINNDDNYDDGQGREVDILDEELE